AECAEQFNFIRYHVSCKAACDLTERKYGWQQWIALAGDHLLQAGNYLCSDSNGVNRLVRQSSVPAFTFDGNVYFIGARHVLPRPEARSAAWQVRVYMQSEYGFRSRIFQYTGGYH